MTDTAQHVDALIKKFTELPRDIRVEFVKRISAVADDADLDTYIAAAGAGPLRPLLSPMQASANPNNRHMLQDIRAHAARLGFSFDPTSRTKLDTVALDQAIRGKDPTSRMDLKCKMAKLNLIP